MQHADVAVVVPVYNRAATVVRTLASVAAQTLPPRRIIIVDDGSTDETADAVRRWARDESRGIETLVISQPNQGAGAARNRGLELVGACRYVAFLDSDDHWPEDFLSRATIKLGGDDYAVAATADRRFHRHWKRRAGFGSSRQIEPTATAWLLKNNAGIASCTVFRAKTLRLIGGFDPAIPTGQDIELFLRVSVEGRWLHVPGAPVRFYVGFTTAEGEESNLSYKYADRMRRWTRIRERFIFKQNGARHVPEAVYARTLAKLWHKVARSYAARGQAAWAKACYRKALRYHPRRVSTHLRLTQIVASQQSIQRFRKAA